MVYGFPAGYPILKNFTAVMVFVGMYYLAGSKMRSLNIINKGKTPPKSGFFPAIF